MIRRGGVSPTTVIAVIALVVALGGTAVAASRYVITNTSQIKPSVLRTLASSSSLVVARARNAGPVTTAAYPALAWIPLNGSSWTQGAEEVDQVGGQINYTTPAGCSLRPVVDMWIDGRLTSAEVSAMTEPGESATAPTQNRWIVWKLDTSRITPALSLEEPIFEPGRTTIHKLTMEAADRCASVYGSAAHITINSVSVDVIGTH